MTVKNKNILVTGGCGMIGSALSRELVNRGANVTIADNLSRGSLDNIEDFSHDVNFKKLDLRHPDSARIAVGDNDVIIMLAAVVDGITELLDKPASTGYTNTMIDLNTINAAKESDAKQVVFASSACSYGPSCTVPVIETDTKMGLDFDSIYGREKYYMEHLIRAYGQQYGIKSTILRFFNVFSEFEPLSIKSHVIPCFCYKAMVLKQDPFEVWGSGEQTRSFVHTDDIVNGILLAMEKAPDGTPINLGTPEKVKIKDLAKMVLEYSGHNPNNGIIYDTSKPEGVHDRAASNERAKRLLGWEPSMSFEEALKQTVEGFRKKARKAI